MFDLKINSQLDDVVLKREGAAAAFTDAITQVLQRPNPGKTALDATLRCLSILEQSGNYELSRSALRHGPGRVREQHQ